MNVIKKIRWPRLAILSIVTLLYISISITRIKLDGINILRLTVFTLITASFLFGLKKGLLYFVIISIYNFLLLKYNGLLVGSMRALASQGALIGIGMTVLVGVLSDMYTKNVKLTKKLKELTLIDPLTNLYNRRYIHEVVKITATNFLYQKTLPEAQKRNMNIKDKFLAVLLLDVDYFKKINDAYGHEAGDAILVYLSDKLKELLRFDDIVVRWGGEEFLLILTNIQKEFIFDIMIKIRDEISSAAIKVFKNKEINITVSIGGTYYPFYETDPEMISFEHAINISDHAMYLSKQNGRNSVTLVTTGEEPTDYDNILKQLDNYKNNKEVSGIKIKIRG